MKIEDRKTENCTIMFALGIRSPALLVQLKESAPSPDRSFSHPLASSLTSWRRHWSQQPGCRLF